MVFCPCILCALLLFLACVFSAHGSRRNHKGGTVSDDQLSAAQLRARHGIQSNARDFGEKGGDPTMMIVGVVVALAVVGAIVYFAV